MRNAVSFFKHYAARLTVSSWPACTLALGLGLVLSGQTQVAAATGDGPGALAVPGQAAPLLARIFTPRHAPAGAYQVAVLPQGIAEATRAVREALNPSARPDAPAGAWVTRTEDALDAFGTAGTYDRSRMARLYSGHGPSVVRAPVVRDGVTVASVMLCSPYPDATLTRLEPGTLVIVIDLQKATGVRGP